MKRSLVLAAIQIGLIFNTCLHADHLALFSRFEFNGDFTDTLGNSNDFIGEGTGFFSDSSFVFGNDDGLCLFTEITRTQFDYRIEMDVSFSDLEGWDKLLDFQNRSNDEGLYINAGPINELRYLPGPSEGSFEIGIAYTISLERIAAKDMVIGSVDGSKLWSFVGADAHTGGLPGERPVYFFLDDFQTLGQEGVAGSVDEIRIYTPIMLGDINQDGSVDLLDVAPFVELLTNGEFQVEGDFNRDGVVDLLDVAPFVALVTGG